MLFKKSLASALLIAVGLSLSTLASAANPATANMGVSLTVASFCSVTATNLAFGTQNALNPAAFTQTTAGSVTVTCSKTTPYIVGMTPSNGLTAGQGTMSGAISGNTDKVTYTLYKDALWTIPWGSSGTLSAPGNEVAGTGTGVAQTAVSVYSKVLTDAVTPDSYTDTVLVSVSY